MPDDPWVLVAGGFHNKGGMDKANLALAEYLVGEGVETHLVTYSADPAIALNPLIRLHLVRRPLNSFTLARPLLDMTGRLTAQKVTSQYPTAKVVVNGINCSWAGINWAHYVHHAWDPEFEGSTRLERGSKAIVHRLERSKEKAAYSKARLIIANSNVTRRHILHHFPSIGPESVKTIYLGSDPPFADSSATGRDKAGTAPNLSRSKYYAAFVGALGTDNRKGIDTLLAAWKVLCASEHWDVDLLVAGDGRCMPVLRAQVESWGLAERIRLLGFSPDVRKLLAESDILVSPTRYEAYGLNVHEAICSGIPSITSASSGIAERYPENLRPFLMSNPESVAELVQKLKLWRSNTEMWKSRFRPFASVLQSRSWQDMAREFVSRVAEAGDSVLVRQAALNLQ